jgi:hypothetical protein
MLIYKHYFLNSTKKNINFKIENLKILIKNIKFFINFKYFLNFRFFIYYIHIQLKIFKIF